MNDEIIKEIPMECLFCSAVLTAPSDYEPKSGDQIKCQNCGRTNDYDSLMAVAKEKVEQMAKKVVDDKFEKFAKDFNKMFK
jgi:predicted nucleic acid-binding OB-fold protein